MTTQNIFEGINPILNEKLLRENWQELHNLYLADMLKLLRADLTHKGYTVGLEESVQVYRMGDDPIAYRPDILISRLSHPPTPSIQPQNRQIYATEVLPITDMLISEEVPNIMAVVIRKRGQNKPITWIELLSPTNKLPNHVFYDYQFKRDDIVKSGICYIELDFIHTQPPTSQKITQYQQGGFPFHGIVMIPRPTIQEGHILLYHFGIADKIPTITIPLDGEDTHLFDFNMVYQKIFLEASYGLTIDYADLSLKTYSDSDREYIRQRISSLQK